MCFIKLFFLFILNTLFISYVFCDAALRDPRVYPEDHPSAHRRERKRFKQTSSLSQGLQTINRSSNFIVGSPSKSRMRQDQSAVQQKIGKANAKTTPSPSDSPMESFSQDTTDGKAIKRDQTAIGQESLNQLRKGEVSNHKNMQDKMMFLANDDVLGTVDCPPASSSSFIRIPHSMIMGKPTLIINMNVLDCSSHCHNNTDPGTGNTLSCQGFNYKDTTVPTCEFFDGDTQLGPLNRNVEARSFFFDKVCLSGADGCAERPYAFEAIPDAMLRGNVLKSITVMDEATCLSACLREPSFTCQSVNYDRARRICEMSRFSRRNKLADFDENVRGVDYFENNCLTKDNRCRSGSTYFVKTVNQQLNGFRISDGMHPLNTCLQKCLNEERLFCRSVEFSLNKGECHVSDEDSFSEPNMAKTAVAINVDLYEPVCLPGADDRSIRCERPFLFEKVVGMALLAPSNFRVLNGMTAEDCMMACARDSRCSSLNFNKNSQTCMLSEYDRRNTSAKLETTETMDYFENNCKRVANVQGCFFTLEGVGRRLRPEFTAKETLVDKALECKISCIEAHDGCMSISYNSRSRSCIHSNLNHKSAPFELLTVVDDTYDTYIKGDCLLNDKKKKNAVLAVDSNDVTQFGGPQNTLQIQPTKKVPMESSEAPIVVNLHPSASNESLSGKLKSDLIYPSRLPRKTGTDFVSTNMSNLLSNNTSFQCNVRLRSLQRTIRPFYRSDIRKLATFSDCQKACESSIDFHCRSLSFSIKHAQCALSELTVPDYPFGVLTHFHPDFNFFLVDECNSTMVNNDEEHTQDQVEKSVFVNVLHSPNGEPMPSNEAMMIIPGYEDMDMSQTTQKMLMIMPPSPKTLLYDQGKPEFDQNTPRLPDMSPEQQKVERRPRPGQSPIQLQRQSGIPGNTLAPSSISVDALCTPDGVNITVTTQQLYSGAIYAAERFSFCRNLVTSQSNFWLFLPKPEINSACNTIMVNDILSGVVVISNDQVIPYDITTKDDLFYQVSCDYSRQFSDANGARIVVTSGLVIGGPTPRVVAGSGNPTAFDANLRILRNGIPVQSVLIGEILTLSIESSVDPARMMLMNCNVTRIGGQGAPPEALPIVDRGCPSVNQIMGPVTRGRLGLQSPLTAFRIDGSAEIQIVCMVMFCPQLCTPVVCSSDSGGSFSSFGRKKREVNQFLEDMNSDNFLEAVNGRLRVMVQGEEFPKDEFSSMVEAGSCIPEATFIAVTCVLAALVALLMTSLGCMLFRRSWMVALQHKLIAQQLQTNNSNRPCDTSFRGYSSSNSLHQGQRGRGSNAMVNTSQM